MALTMTLQTLQLHVSSARLAPYQALTSSDDAAVRLYEWNARISAAMWETLGHVEVIIRNAIHRELTAWSNSRHGQPLWYLDPGGYLTSRHVDDVRLARRRATIGGRPEFAGRVVAELTFGFWRYLAANHYDRTLWRSAMYRAFPGQSRRDVHDALRELHRVRNRCAHHEPIHGEPIRHLYETALDVVGWVSGDGRRWVAATSRVGRNLALRP